MRALIRNARQLQLLRQSFALLKPDFDLFTSRSDQRFYQLLPADLNNVVRADSIALHRDLITAFEAAIQHAERPERLASLLTPMVSRHLMGKGIRPVHLAILVNCLMTTAGEMLEAEWTAEVENAWDEALHTLLLVMIKAVWMPSQASGD